MPKCSSIHSLYLQHHLNCHTAGCCLSCVMIAPADVTQPAVHLQALIPGTNERKEVASIESVTLQDNGVRGKKPGTPHACLCAHTQACPLTRFT